MVGSIPDLDVGWLFPGDSGFPPVFFSSLALLKITVNPSAEAGSLTSHSPNLGNGLPLSVMNTERGRERDSNEEREMKRKKGENEDWR